MCVRYFSKSRKTFVTDFLGLIEVVSCTGENLANALLEYIDKIGLPRSQFFGIGTDGANNMCGVDNSMYTHLKRQIPQLQLLTCVCHSLNKFAERAFKTMPDDLNYIMAETSNYFAHSSLRWDAYVKYCKANL